MAKVRRPRRGFGKIKALPSGRYQGSYVGPDMQRHTAPQTFETRMDAEAWLSVERRSMAEPETWTSPKLRAKSHQGGLTLRDYAPDALDRRRSRGEPLKPRTLALYRGLLERVIYPELGDVPMRVVSEDRVRRWHDGLPPEHRTQRAHAYALLKSLFDQARAEHRLVGANPCAIKGAGVTRRSRDIRPATLDELRLIVEATPERVRLLVLLCAWCGLRFGEVAELRRGDIDLEAGVLRIRRAVVRIDGAEIVGSPKSEAGVRDVAIPPHLIPAIAAHLSAHVGAGRMALVFPHHPGEDKHWTHGMFYKLWMVARDHAGRSDLRLHDLRHTAAIMAAQSGATLAELMARLGHSTPAAAMRYQHAAQGRDAEIARRLSDLAGRH